MEYITNKSFKEKTLGVIKQLFATPLNAILTIVIGIIVARILFSVLSWGIFNATWIGDTRQFCIDNTKNGACWIFIEEKIRFFFYGFIKRTEYWRINILLICYAVLISLPFIKTKIPFLRNKLLLLSSYLIIFPVLTSILAGKGLGLPQIALSEWGGATLTFIFSFFGLLLSFPLGILLALGRQSKLPIIRALSVGYIEFFRGIPLISILFMAANVVPYFFPPGVEIPKIIRVIGGFVLFQSAYLAEVVRGGLNVIKKIQYESADSLGLNYVQKTYFIILPQALKAVVVNIGDISVSFIKDTTLVYIIGLFDMLGIYVPLTADTKWLGMESEALVFSGLFYWLLCSGFVVLIKFVDKKINKERRIIAL